MFLFKANDYFVLKSVNVLIELLILNSAHLPELDDESSSSIGTKINQIAQ